MKKQTAIIVSLMLSALTAFASDRFIPGLESMEEYRWTRGCTPTAAAMIFSYHNRRGYNNLIRYYKHHADSGHNVPDVLDDLADAMGTSDQGSTSPFDISPGIRRVARNRGYGFGSEFQWGSRFSVRRRSRNLCWNYIRDLIRDHRQPFIWSLPDPVFAGIGFSGHSLAAVGYNSQRKEVIVYDSNENDPPGLQYWRYNVYEYTGKRVLYAGVNTVVPPLGSYSSRVIFLSPHMEGGNVLYGGGVPNVQWYQSGDDAITHVNILLSRDSGRTWRSLIGRDVPSRPGVNQHPWRVPEIENSNMRIRIIGYDRDGVVRAGDSSRSDFSVALNTRSFTVHIDPEEARERGARWRVVPLNSEHSASGWRDSGESVDLRLGDYVIECTDIEDYCTPDNRTINIPNLLQTTVRYLPSQNELTVYLEPEEAREAGAQWRVVDGSYVWRDSGDSEALPTGERTVQFRDLPNWLSPEDITVNVSPHRASVRRATYTHWHIGHLQIRILPHDARTAGARWRREGTDRWFSSGETEYRVPVGEHAVEFKRTARWDEPVDYKINVQERSERRMTHGYTIGSAHYTPHVGEIVVTLPAELDDLGARWRIADQTDWMRSGDTVGDLPVGWYEIEMNDIGHAQWITPSPFTVAVTNMARVERYVQYIPVEGSVRVILSPLRAKFAGAEWRLAGGSGDWYQSSDVKSGVSTGMHTVIFQDVAGWDTPTNQSVNILFGETTETSGAYSPMDMTALCMALAYCRLEWITGGDAAWFAQSDYVYKDKQAGQSGKLENGEVSWIGTTVEGPGTLRFHWAVSSRKDIDGLLFQTRTGIEEFQTQHQLTGQVDWEEVVYEVPAGTHNLRWLYSKHEMEGAHKPDCGWLDHVIWQPDDVDLADMAVVEAHVGPLTVDRGATVSLFVAFENQGHATAEDFSTAWFLATEEDMTDPIMSVGSRFTTRLEPGERIDWTDGIWRVPPDMEPGTYYLAAVVDPMEDIEENNKFNNQGPVFELTVTGDQRLPDITVSESSVHPAVVAPGDTVDLTATILNQGPVAAEGFFAAWYLLDTPESSLDHALNDTRITGLEAAESLVWSNAVWIVPENLEDGGYYLVAVADDDGELFQSDTNNNRGIAHRIDIHTPEPKPASGEVVIWGRHKSPDAPLRGIRAVCAGPWHSIALTTGGEIIGWGNNFEGQVMTPAGNDFEAIASGGSHGLALRSDGAITGWGFDILGQATPPEGTDFVAVAAGELHSLALLADGGIVGWGDDEYGKATPPEGTNYVAIAAGAYHSLALRADGGVVGWGDDEYGQSTPPEGTNYVAIAAGVWHSLALRADGSVAAWGWNEYGQSTPPEGKGFVAIAAGREHSLALHADGSIVAWGHGNLEQTNAPAGNAHVAIAAGSFHSLALTADGELIGWGDNSQGQSAPLTDAGYTTVAASFDVQYSLALKSDGRIDGVGQYLHADMQPSQPGYLAVAAGNGHALALHQDGGIIAWGVNDYGQIDSPEGNDFIAVAAAANHSLALHADGGIVGWGADQYGQATPPEGSNYVAIAAGAYHSLALRADGSIAGWGDDQYGQATPPEGSNFVAIAAGGFHSLALRDDGGIVGWGANYDGQASAPPGKGFVSIAAGWGHSLALHAEGNIVAWGGTYFTETSTPPAGNDYIAIAAGQFHSVAIRAADRPVWSLYITESEDGITMPPSGLYHFEVGQNAVVGATGTNGRRFRHWLLEGASVSDRATYEVASRRSGDVVVLEPVFSVATELPYVWLDQHEFRRDISMDIVPPGKTLTLLKHYVAGIDPNDPESEFKIADVRRKPHDIDQLQVPGLAGRRYRVYRTDSLMPPINWQLIETYDCHYDQTVILDMEREDEPYWFYMISVELYD